MRNQLAGLLWSVRRHREAVGELGPTAGHFLRVSRSYWPGRIACYDAPVPPRTNNDLEHLFGSHRYQDRRAVGRIPRPGAAGSARPVAGLATRVGAGTAADLSGVDREE